MDVPLEVFHTNISSTGHSPQNSPVKGEVEMHTLPLPAYSEDFTLVRVKRPIPVTLPYLQSSRSRNPLENRLQVAWLYRPRTGEALNGRTQAGHL